MGRIGARAPGCSCASGSLSKLGHTARTGFLGWAGWLRRQGCLVKGYTWAHGLCEVREWLRQYVPAMRAKVLPLSGSCVRLAVAARSQRMLRGTDFAPVRGDLALFDLEGVGKPTHVGLVRSATATQGVPEVRTVEGNTSSGVAGSQRDGGGVYERVRPVAKVYGFVHFGAV